MQRIKIEERPYWREMADQSGFIYHTINGEPYWDETAYYAFTLEQIERDLEAPSEELHQLCLELVARAVRDEEILTRLAIPRAAWDAVRESYFRNDATLYGRFDFSYNGEKPAKLLEYNADTPTSLFEAASFQWAWLEDLLAQGQLPKGSDQFNSIHDKLCTVLRTIARRRKVFGSSYEESDEDTGTVSYILECAALSGLETGFVPINQIGLLDDGYFCDAHDEPISLLFKLYPWEWMFQDSYAPDLALTPTRFLEPPWKAILSNKGILPLLWQMEPGHPNLLPAFFEDDPHKFELGADFVKKPLFSREGANILLIKGEQVMDSGSGNYGQEGYIRQAASLLPCFDGHYPVIGSWIIGNEAAGIGIREDKTLVTRDTSRFLPHIISA